MGPFQGRTVSLGDPNPPSKRPGAARKWPANNSIVDHARLNLNDFVEAPSPIHLGSHRRCHPLGFFAWPFLVGWFFFWRGEGC